MYYTATLKITPSHRGPTPDPVFPVIGTIVLILLVFFFFVIIKIVPHPGRKKQPKD